MKLNKPRIVFTPDSHFVTNPIINLWSSLHCSTVTASTASCLKRKLDIFLLQVYYF